MVNNYTKDLNTVLINSHYPHLRNKLFNNLTLPHGLIINNPKLDSCKTVTICDSKQCLSQDIYDKLVTLVEIKKDKKDKKDKKNKNQLTKKKNKMKREKKTRKN